MVTRGFAPEDDVQSLYVDKLASSGLSPEDGKELGMYPYTAAQSAEKGLWKGFGGLPALIIPYFNPLTGKPVNAHTEWPLILRARALRLPVSADKNFPKYYQVARTGNGAYYPRMPSVIDWPAIFADYNWDVYITEGELKAAKACKEGFPTLALPGVHNFRNKLPETSFLPALEEMPWVRRIVRIVYDSDIMKNKNVALAAQRLADELNDRGAIVYIVVLPALGDKKVGLDDYLIEYGRETFDDLCQTQSRSISITQVLWDINKRYIAVEEGDQEVVDIQTGMRVKAAQFKYRTTKKIADRRLTSDGKITNDPISAAVVWLSWPLRNEVRRLVYKPSEPAFESIENEVGSYDFNTWPGLACEPVEGDVSPFLTLIDHLFTGALPSMKDWFLNWLAYPVTHLGTKLLTAVVIHGPVQGTGKTLIGETMKYIYGNTYTKIGQLELSSQFNEWAASRSFILGDDLTGTGGRLEMHDRLKAMITQTRAWINPKGLTPYELDDYASWLFTSNRADAFYLDNDDRRFFIWEVPESAGKHPRSFYKMYMEWLAGSGPSHLLYWLQHRDLSAFDPGDAAPETSSKTKMREEARSDIDNWCSDLRRIPNDILADPAGNPLSGDLFTNLQLRGIYASKLKVEPDARMTRSMGIALSTAGFNQVNGRKPIKVKGEHMDRYYAIRNADKWLNATVAEIQSHLSPEEPKLKRGSAKKY